MKALPQVLLVLILALGGLAACQAPESGAATLEPYYSAAAGLSGSSLKAALHTIISTGATRLTYAQVWAALEYTDEDPDNTSNVLEIYTGWSIPKTAKSQNNEAYNWNREHVWAKSHGDFDTDPGPGTDLHHLRPADASINSTRNNNDFDNGGTVVTDNSPYGDYEATTTNLVNGTLSFEPRDEDKGDVARMMFYMAVRYEGTDGTSSSTGSDWVDLELNETVGNESAPYIGKLSTLKAWNDEDPVDAWEKRRNDRVEELQGNRNPFIDHPEWVEAIW